MGTAVYIANLSVGYMHDPPHPKVSWGESSFSRGESKAFATGGGVLLNLLFLSSIEEVGQLTVSFA